MFPLCTNVEFLVLDVKILVLLARVVRFVPLLTPSLVKSLVSDGAGDIEVGPANSTRSPHSTLENNNKLGIDRI
jgi:hypothetical protein